MRSRNQREGYYVGRLQGLHGIGKRYVRSGRFNRAGVRAELATLVWSRAHGIRWMPHRPYRDPWTARHFRRFSRALSMSWGRPASFRLDAAARDRLRRMLGRT